MRHCLLLLLLRQLWLMLLIRRAQAKCPVQTITQQRNLFLQT
jgi:hypothetical protein